MSDRLDTIEARLIAIELFVRSILASMVSRSTDPIGDLDRMASEFRSSTGFLQITGAGDDHAEHMRDLIRARGDENFAAIVSRIFRDIEIEAARASKN
jgi:hypothetical protein